MPTESELRLHRCCFTGHRPHKLNKPEAMVIDALEDVIVRLFIDNFYEIGLIDEARCKGLDFQHFAHFGELLDDRG